MKLNGFSSGSDVSENNYFVLRISLCLPESLNFSRHLSASSDFLRWPFPSLQDDLRSLFNGCKNKTKEIHELLVISEP